MKRISVLALGATILLLPLMVIGQIPNEGLVNGILAARKKEAAMLQQYNWNRRTEILQDGNMQDIRIDLMSCPATGIPQGSMINDIPGKLPGGFIRKKSAENKRKELEEYLGGIRKLVDQYTLPSAGKIVDFLATATITPGTTPEGTSILTANGNGVVTPGDTFTMVFDGKTMQAVSVQVSTIFKGDPVAVTATFKQIANGPNYMQYATVQATGKEATVNIHNYDFVRND